MYRTVHSVVQGSPEWHALRASHFCASEAPAMMGCNSYMSRGELLRCKATGMAPDVDEATQRRFAEGHAAETAFRTKAEEIIGDELYPSTITVEVDGLPLLASMDGLTMDGTTGFEHKLLNNSLYMHVKENGEPPMQHVWQLEHQLLVSGAERILFVTSDGTAENAAWCWYQSKAERRKALIEGWRQFKHDLEDPEMAAAMAASAKEPKPIGKSPETLPALRIEVRGEVVASNLNEWHTHALAVIRSINRDLKTDQDFADAERTVKWCADVEARLKAAKEAALAQAADIDRLFRTVDDVAEELRKTRLELDRLVKARKDAIRAEIQQEALARLRDQIAKQGECLGEYAPSLPLDAAHRIAEAMKGKKTLASLKDAADAERAVIAQELHQCIARRAVNLSTANAIAAETGMGHLWQYDLKSLLDNDPGTLADLLRGRVAAYKEQEARKQAEASQIQKGQAEIPPKAIATEEELIKLSDINAWISPLSITAAGLSRLGFEPVKRDRAAFLYRASDFKALCDKLIKILLQVSGR